MRAADLEQEKQLLQEKVLAHFISETLSCYFAMCIKSSRWAGHQRSGNIGASHTFKHFDLGAD